MKRKIFITLILSVVVISLCAVFFAACNNIDNTGDGGIYIPPRDPSGVPSGDKEEPEKEYNTIEDCEGELFYDKNENQYIIQNGKAVISRLSGNEEVFIPSKVQFDKFEFQIEEIPNTDSYSINIKNIIIEEGITKICDYAFGGFTSLEEITIPDSVKEIGKGAFSQCESLKDITIPDSVVEIGENAFYNCKSLRNLIIPNGVKTIKRFLVYDCTSLEKLVIPDSVEYIDYYMSYKLPSLKTLVLPFVGISQDRPCRLSYLVGDTDNLESVTITGDCDIVEDSLAGYSNLKEINFEGNIRRIYGGAIDSCPMLRSITIPDSVTLIGSNFNNMECIIKCETAQKPEGWINDWNSENNVIWDCNNNNNELEDGRTIVEYEGFIFTMAEDGAELINYLSFNDMSNVEIPRYVPIDGKNIDVKVIADYVFKNVKNIDTVNLPDSVETIGSYAFAGSSIKSIKLSENLKVIKKYAFYQSQNLADINIPNSVVTIEDYAFAYSGVSNVKLSENLKVIKFGVFRDCKLLTDITLPDSVETIDMEAFSCSGIKNIKLSENLTGISIKAFASCENLTSITFPASLQGISIDAFINSGLKEAHFIDKSDWCLFTNGLEKIDISVDDPVANAELLLCIDYANYRSLSKK